MLHELCVKFNAEFKIGFKKSVPFKIKKFYGKSSLYFSFSVKNAQQNIIMDVSEHFF